MKHDKLEEVKALSALGSNQQAAAARSTTTSNTSLYASHARGVPSGAPQRPEAGAAGARTTMATYEDVEERERQLVHRALAPTAAPGGVRAAGP